MLPTLLFFSLVLLSSTEKVLTPFGFRDSECVLEVPHGSTVSNGEGNELIISTPTSADSPPQIQYYKAPAHFGNDIEDIRQKRSFPDNPKQTNGWLDYVGWYPPNGQNNIRSFTSTYVVPENPQTEKAGQVLFYFIGIQDNDSPSALNILQPVLTWGNGYYRWYITSWACCPKNITVSSPPLFGLESGNSFQGEITRVSESTWRIDSIFNGQHTTLNAQVGDYIYNWADITLEVYFIDNCPQFARGKAYFNNLKLTDAQGETLNPSWQRYSGETLCGGTISSAGSASYVIEHKY